MDQRAILLRERELERDRIELLEGLPHLHGFKFYKWARTFIESTNHLNFLTAGNQLSKSSTMIRKCILCATSTELWPSLWKTKPRIFIYLYPSYDVATREVKEKWIPEFLPRGKFKDDPIYGWKDEYDKKDIKLIRFNSGVVVYFLAYAQHASVLQSTTVHAAFLDEEVPEHIWTELRFRMAATSGYMHMAFTGTLGQQMFYSIMEERGKEELFPQALKLQVSAFDCMYYEDGTKSHWTKEKIDELIASCPTEQEVQKRVYGRIVKTEGLRYPSFSRARNVKKDLTLLPSDWLVYSGIDLGSGTERGHPSAITFVGVKPDFKMARVFKHWNGRGHLTTAADVFQKFLELRGNHRCVIQAYDCSGRDYGTIAQRAGESFVQAKKDRELGDNLINSLFKNEMLFIDELDESLQLVRELERANDRDRKTTALDDSVDSLRYALMYIPFDWQFLNPITPDDPVPEPETLMEKRLAAADRARHHQEPQNLLEMNLAIEDEIRFWSDINEMY